MDAYNWLWTLLATTVLLLVAAAILAWRLQSRRRELASARLSLQQSQGEVRRLGLELDRLAREHAEPPELVPAQPEPATGRHGGFLSRMGHELRTPLNGILYYAQVLQREPSLTQRQQRGLRTIAESGQHLLSLIEDVVELARMDAGAVELVPAEVRLSEFLKRVSDVVRVQAEAKGLAFRVQAAALPAAVRVDERRLRQVLLHLLGNAVKFTARGQVTLDVSCAPRAAPHGGQAVRLRFEVCDSGIGMDDAQLARLFQPFEPLGTTKERAAGAGLGLVISRQLVRLMGGDIQARSRPGEGSTFWFEVDAVVADVGADASSTRGVPADDARSALPADRSGWQDQRHPAPPAEELAVLRELARIGNMRAIRERADYLKNLDIRYRPFAEQLGQLAEQCQSMAISILVESYVAEAKVAEPAR